MKRYIIVTMLILTAAAVFCTGKKEEKLQIRSEVSVAVEKTEPSSVDDSIHIQNTAGRIDVRGWDREEIKIQGSVGIDVIDVDIHRTGTNMIAVDVILPDNDNLTDLAGAAELEILIPRQCPVDILSMAAEITVTGVNGGITIRTVAGPVTIAATDGAGPVRVSTLAGDVAISGPFVSVSVESTTGDIDIDGASGELICGTTSGSISIENTFIQSAELSAGLGDISVDCEISETGILRASTALGGRIDLTVPDTIEGRITMSSGAGTVNRSSFKPAAGVVTVFKMNRSLPGIQRMEGVTGKIGTSGSVTIKRNSPASVPRSATGEIKGSITMKTESGEERPFVLLGGSLTEIVVGKGGSRIYLETQSPISKRRDEENEAPASTIVLKTKSQSL